MGLNGIGVTRMTPRVKRGRVSEGCLIGMYSVSEGVGEEGVI